MQLQTVNRSTADRVWVNFTNGSAATITAHYTLFWIAASKKTASVNGNDAALAADAVTETAGGQGLFVGLADADTLNGAVGRAQVYGYHESVQIFRIVGSVTVACGDPMGPGDMSASVGVSSVGAIQGVYGPMVAMDTVTATMHSLGTVETNFANSIFLRCM